MCYQESNVKNLGGHCKKIFTASIKGFLTEVGVRVTLSKGKESETLYGIWYSILVTSDQQTVHNNSILIYEV